MLILEKLSDLVSQLNRYANYGTAELNALEKAANSIEKSWSQSTLGYHSRVYYSDFQLPPRGTAFDYTRGLAADPSLENSLGWQEYDHDSVIQIIEEKVGNSFISLLSTDYEKAMEVFDSVKSLVLSLIYANYPERDQFLQGLLEAIEASEIFFNNSFIETKMSQDEIISSDQRAIDEGPKIPPHIEVLQLVLAAKQSFESCNDLKKQILTLTAHIENIEHKIVKPESVSSISNNIFIVHGRDDATKDAVTLLVRDLGFQEIILDRQPNSGLTIIEKFEQHASNAGFAIALLTPDDVGALKEEADKELKLRARQNVILELGYFMGKLGRERVCLLLKGNLENPSDLDGVLYVPMGDEPQVWRYNLAKEMKSAGLPVDMNKL